MTARALLAAGVLGTLLTLAAGRGHAELLDSLNEARSRGCERRLGAPPLRADARLVEAAQHLARGGDLRTGMAKAGYRGVLWTSIHVADEGLRDDDLARAVAERFCAHLADPAFRDAGIARGEGRTWIVLAVPFTAPAPEDAPQLARRVLELTNEARSQPRRCGNRTLAAVGPLRPAAALDRAALAHSQEMATHGNASHKGRDGSHPAERAARAGYRWRAIGENIAAGPGTAEVVVRGWLESPRHCANLMDARYTEMGIAYAVNPASKQGVYWTQMLGAPR